MKTLTYESNQDIKEVTYVGVELSDEARSGELDFVLCLGCETGDAPSITVMLYLNDELAEHIEFDTCIPYGSLPQRNIPSDLIISQQAVGCTPAHIMDNLFSMIAASEAKLEIEAMPEGDEDELADEEIDGSIRLFLTIRSFTVEAFVRLETVERFLRIIPRDDKRKAS